MQSSAAPEKWRNPLFASRIAELDGLRGAAILLVLIFHYVAVDYTPPPGGFLDFLWAPLRMGWSGVDLFFVLSGFLITGILVDSKDSPRYFRTFYLRRMHRILPIYGAWLALFGLGIALIALSGHGPRVLFNRSIPLWSYALFLQNCLMAARKTWGTEWMSVTWSLAVEEQFYLVIPLIIRICSLRNTVRLLLLAVIAAPLFRQALAGNFFAQYTLLPCRADALGIGALAAIALRHQPVWRWLERSGKALPTALLALFAAVIYYTWHRDIPISIAYSGIALFYMVMLVRAVIRPGRFYRAALRGRFLQELGCLSYALYMFHQGVKSLVHLVILRNPPVPGSWRTAAAQTLALVLTVLLAKLSWTYYEHPLIRRAHRHYRY